MQTAQITFSVQTGQDDFTLGTFIDQLTSDLPQITGIDIRYGAQASFDADTHITLTGVHPVDWHTFLDDNSIELDWRTI